MFEGESARGETGIGGVKFSWGRRAYVMGIINLSPDSFSGDGVGMLDDALNQARRFVDEGADILDIGGESTRPNSAPVTVDEELGRVIPAIEGISARFSVPLSIDTYKTEIARKAVDAGAGMINDIWGLKKSPDLANVAAEKKVPLIITANERDKPATDIMKAVLSDLDSGINIALKAGVPASNIILDPGIGFGKTREQNLEVVRRLAELKTLGKPVLLGTSRKSFIGLTLNLPEDDRLEGTAASVAIGIYNGADIIRVHDVRAMYRVARMSDAIMGRRT